MTWDLTLFKHGREEGRKEKKEKEGKRGRERKEEEKRQQGEKERSFSHIVKSIGKTILLNSN